MHSLFEILLFLLMFRVCTNNTQMATTSYHLTVLTKFFYSCSYFHNIICYFANANSLEAKKIYNPLGPSLGHVTYKRRVIRPRPPSGERTNSTLSPTKTLIRCNRIFPLR